VSESDESWLLERPREALDEAVDVVEDAAVI